MENIKSGAARAGKFLFRLLDMVKFGEIMDFIFGIVKFNTRTLSSTEEEEAKKVFAGSINYHQVRIDEYSLIAAIGAFFQGGGGMGVTLFHTINFNKKINTTSGNNDMAWLIHELTHISQYEHVGSQYIGEAMYAQATTGYNYGGGSSLSGKDLKDFNREQQGDIIRDYYINVLYGSSVYASEYQRLQQQLVKGDL